MGRLRRPVLILASASPRRRAILRAAGLSFRVDPSTVHERSREPSPRRRVIRLAERKARQVARRHPGVLVLGSDTLVYCGGEILGKPKDRADALRMLKLQSAKPQKVYTGVALVRDARCWSGAAVSTVIARRLSDAALAKLAGKHLDKAGAYAIQDRKDPLVARVIGDRDTVTGLSMRLVRSLLAKARRSRSEPRAR
jgi:septum formation protein